MGIDLSVLADSQNVVSMLKKVTNSYDHHWIAFVKAKVPLTLTHSYSEGVL